MAEFDKFSNTYSDVNNRDAISITGFDLDYFNRYKIRDMLLELEEKSLDPKCILDFGCGVGNSLVLFPEYFPKAHFVGVDVSLASIEVAKSKIKSDKIVAKSIQDEIDITPGSVDAVFSSCVFHHIPVESHKYWLSELYRTVKPGGSIMVYEHNPLNPLTQYVFRNAEFDRDANMINATKFSKLFEMTGFHSIQVRYRVFFPKLFDRLMGAEKYLTRIPFGAQYYIFARK